MPNAFSSKTKFFFRFPFDFISFLVDIYERTLHTFFYKDRQKIIHFKNICGFQNFYIFIITDHLENMQSKCISSLRCIITIKFFGMERR